MATRPSILITRSPSGVSRTGETMPYYAHSGRDTSAARIDWQFLDEHLLGVAKGARERASSVKSRTLGLPFEDAAYAAGLSHDLGKYRPGFQGKLSGDPFPRVETYHKGAGAATAWSSKSYAAAFAIAGHHGGLPNKVDLRDDVRKNVSFTPVADRVWPVALVDCAGLRDLRWPSTSVEDPLLFDLEARLLFSCLVDADWADTAEHDRTVRGWPEEPGPPRLTKQTAKTWLDSVLATLREKVEEGDRTTRVATARGQVLQAALNAAVGSLPGFFSLTVPTGGGKTLSGLAFALAHAAEHQLRRIIYVAPYLTILDQNARAIREAMGIAPDGPEVLEHHCLADPTGEPPSPAGLEGEADASQGTDQDQARRAAAARRAENWDAPVIITTNVQFFESLFSNEPGRCRKLHNVARSVIVLDECQAIPPELFAPTCSMLTQLVEHLGCTVVLATATQPAFHHDTLVKKGCALPGVREIVAPESGLFPKLLRTRIEWPRPGESLGWDEVAGLMAGDKREGRRAALCVVNSRRAARELFQALNEIHPGASFHLSTWMCPRHRLIVLDEVRARLDAGNPCYLASTQLIEAGVDIDFPLVLREMGPFDAVLQAAGRCNREGTLNRPDGSPGGRVVVFRSRAAMGHPERYFPLDPWYAAGRDTLENAFLAEGRHPQADDPAIVREYYDRLFNMGDLDSREIQSLRRASQFKEVSARYRLIEAGGQPVIAATWSDPPSRGKEIENLIEGLRERPTRNRFRRLAPFQVNLRFPTGRQLSYVEEGPHGVSIWRGGYDPKMGLWDELLADQCVN